MRRGEYPRAAKMLQKSLQLFPLPGVEALYQHAKSKLREEEQQQQERDRNTQSTTSQNGNSNNSNNNNSNNGSTPAPPPRNLNRSGSSTVGADGREYTAEHVDVVHKVLQSQKGGRGAHYRVLNISSTATEAEIKVCMCCAVCMQHNVCGVLCSRTKYVVLEHLLSLFCLIAACPIPP